MEGGLPMLREDELLRVKAILEAEVVDDPEELLIWFGLNGAALIDEVLALRAKEEGD